MSEEKQEGAISARLKKLKEKLGIDTYARYPTELIEFLMDRPPADEVQRAKWKPVQSIKTRVYATYMRYSWCWPICLEYAVVTDPYDGIHYDHMDRPMLLSQEAVATILDSHQQRVADAVAWFVDRKRMRIDLPTGRKKGQAVFLTAKPYFTEEERQRFYRSTPVNQNSDTIVLPEKVQRALSNLFNALGPDERQFQVPSGTLIHASLANGSDPNSALLSKPIINVAGAEAPPPITLTAADLRTQVKRLADTVQLRYLEDFKKVAYSHRKGFSDLSREVRYLIDESQSTEIVCHGSSSSVAADADARASQPTDRPAPSPVSTYTDATTTVAKDALFYQVVAEIFTEAKKGTPTPRQLAAAWKLMPADAEVEEFQTFLLKVEPGKKGSHITRAEHAGILLRLVAEFATEWTKARAEQSNQRFGVRRPAAHEETREEKITRLEKAITSAQTIANDKSKHSPEERARQRERLQELRDELAVLNGKGDAGRGGS